MDAGLLLVLKAGSVDVSAPMRSMQKSAKLPIGAPRSLSTGSWVARQHDRLAARADRLACVCLHARRNEPIEAEGSPDTPPPLE